MDKDVSCADWYWVNLILLWKMFWDVSLQLGPEVKYMFYSFSLDCVALNKKTFFHKQCLLVSTEELHHYWDALLQLELWF